MGESQKDFREHFKHQLGEFDCSENVRVDEMEYLLLKNKPEFQKKIFQFRYDFENKIKYHKLIISTFQILENYQNKQNFIISNNLTSTVETGLKQLGMLDRFVHILGLDKIKLPKPDISAYGMYYRSCNIWIELKYCSWVIMKELMVYSLKILELIFTI